MAVAAFTSFTGAELAQAMILARGLKARQPDWRLYGVLVDAPPADSADSGWRSAFDFVVEAEALFGRSWRGFVFRHDAAEARAAVKARALAFALSEGAEKVFYFAPDMLVFDELGDVERRLDAASILVMPHQTAPNESFQAIADNEALTARYGVFNLGFLGVRNDDAGKALTRWWDQRVHAACYDDPASGLYLDQKCFDLAPALFDGLAVLRDPGCGVASWNLSRREVEIADDGRILVNGACPLKFYHFANAYGDGSLLTERYAGERLAPYELWAFYRRALAASGAPAATAWGYGRFDDGAPIAYAARRLYRDDPEFAARFPDPFACGAETYRAFLETERPDLL